MGLGLDIVWYGMVSYCLGLGIVWYSTYVVGEEYAVEHKIELESSNRGSAT